MKVICYSLFGYDRSRPDGCFDFNSYLRGLMINIRMNRLLFPDWEICLQTDQATYDAWGELFNRLPITIEVHQNGVPLTLAMLWRLRPVYYKNEDTTAKYSHVLCRDLDSIATYREVQAVRYWMNKDKTLHAITDSVSHDLPLLGGMIGIIPKYFTERTMTRTWKELIDKNNSFNWNQKGSDQTFLNQIVYPCVAQKGTDSITQHYVLGHGDTFLSDYHNKIQDMELDIPFEYKESNDCCGHIGSAGYYNGQTSKFINKHADKFLDLIEIEKDYSDLFSWVKNGCY